MGRLESRLVGGVVAVGILTTLSVVVADLGGKPDESLAPASLPPESRAAPTNETELPVPPTAPSVRAGATSFTSRAAS